MKRKALRKVFSVTMIMTLAASMLAGCGSSASDGTTASGGSSDQTASGSSESSEKEAITVSTIDFNSGMNLTGDYADQIMQEVKDYTGVDADITFIQSDVLDEKNNLALTDPGTMPMIMTWNGAVSGNVVSAAKDGAFVDLSKYITADKYPNLAQANSTVNQSLTVNGQLIGVYRARVIARYGVSYRADWAEKLGIEQPKTVDDIYNMLYAFTYDDPDGNGKDDTIGMEMTSYTGPFDIMQTWFGCGNGWADVDGNLVPVFQQDEYMDALNWFKKLYDDGLMPSDWAERTTDTWSNGCKNGENGVYIDVLDGGRRVWDYFTDNNVPSVADSSKTASMTLMGPVNNATLATSGYNGYFTLSSTTCDTDEKIDACLTLLDKMCDDQMLTLADYGLEGVNYEVDGNGNLVDLDTDDTTLSANYAGLNQVVAYIPNLASTTLVPEQTESRIACDEVEAAAEEFAVTNPALPYLINSETYSEIGTTLDEIISSARTQYICGEIDEQGLKDAWQSYLDQGGQKVIDEVNEQYHAAQ